MGDTGDFEDAGFYGFRGEFGGNKDRTQLEIEEEKKRHKEVIEVIATLTEDTDEWGEVRKRYESLMVG